MAPRRYHRWDNRIESEEDRERVIQLIKINLNKLNSDAGIANGTFSVPYTVWSDHAGGTVERSNYRVLLDTLPESGLNVWWADESGNYGSHWIQIIPGGLDQAEDDELTELADTIQGLENYPVLDDDDHSELETELDNEALPEIISNIRRSVENDIEASSFADAIQVDPDDFDNEFFWDLVQLHDSAPWSSGLHQIEFIHESADSTYVNEDQYANSITPFYVMRKNPELFIPFVQEEQVDPKIALAIIVHMRPELFIPFIRAGNVSPEYVLEIVERNRSAWGHSWFKTGPIAVEIDRYLQEIGEA
jgi:hypothetical protein